MKLQKMIEKTVEQGYHVQDARAKVCQDVVLKAIETSNLSGNITVKGGVVMRSKTRSVRRATQDMDIDFIKYSLTEESIDRFLQKLNCLQGIVIEKAGEITELKQQDYHGKSVRISVKDSEGTIISSKIDFGVHNRLEISQEEYCFDIALDDTGVSLLINSNEQMFTEKLRSLLKFGRFSTRYKDIYDMYYFCNRLNPEKLRTCLNVYVFSDSGMRESSIDDVIERVEKTFSISDYKRKVDGSDKRWIDEGIDNIFTTIIQYLMSLREA